MSAVKMVKHSQSRDCYFRRGDEHLVVILLLSITITDEKISFLKGGGSVPKRQTGRRPGGRTPASPI